MSDGIEQLAQRLVIGRKRDGRSIYDAQAKRELIEACRQPGVLLARLARQCGINANQLATWVRQHEREKVEALHASGEVVEMPAAAFLPMQLEGLAPRQAPQGSLSLKARLPNGVVVDLHGCELIQAEALIEALGRLRCSASTKA